MAVTDAVEDQVADDGGQRGRPVGLLGHADGDADREDQRQVGEQRAARGGDDGGDLVPAQAVGAEQVVLAEAQQQAATGRAAIGSIRLRPSRWGPARLSRVFGGAAAAVAGAVMVGLRVIEAVSATVGGGGPGLALRRSLPVRSGYDQLAWSARTDLSTPKFTRASTPGGAPTPHPSTPGRNPCPRQPTSSPGSAEQATSPRSRAASPACAPRSSTPRPSTRRR